MNNSSSRAAPPPPLDLTNVNTNTSTQSSKDKRAVRSFSADFIKPSLSHHGRQDSCSSSISGGSREESHKKGPIHHDHDHHHVHHSPPVNVYTHCGRHTDQFLFGGRSMSDMVRSIWRKD